MTQVSYTRPGTPAKPIKVTQTMADTMSGKSKKLSFKKGQIIGSQSPSKGANINKAPGYTKKFNQKKFDSTRKKVFGL